MKGGRIERMDFTCHPEGHPPVQSAILLARMDGQEVVCAVRAACLEGEQLRIEPPGSDTPTIFRTYPLSGSARYALPVVIHAEFAVNEERREIYLGTDEKEGHHNRGKVSLALSLLPPLAAAGVRLSWGRAHLLARVQPIACDDEAARWWRQELAKTAGRLAREPLVLLDEDGAVPALTDGEGADDPVFPLPLLTATDPQDEPFSPIWSLMERYFGDVPPEDVAADWQPIVRGWEKLGVKVHYAYTLEQLISVMRGFDASLADLANQLQGTQDEAAAWLSDLLAVMAGYHARHHQFPQGLLTGILPDQYGVFRSPQQLSRDQGIDARLKDIAEALDPKGQLSPSRAQLLHQGLARARSLTPSPSSCGRSSRKSRRRRRPSRRWWPRWGSSSFPRASAPRRIRRSSPASTS